MKRDGESHRIRDSNRREICGCEKTKIFCRKKVELWKKKS